MVCLLLPKDSFGGPEMVLESSASQQQQQQQQRQSWDSDKLAAACGTAV